VIFLSAKWQGNIILASIRFARSKQSRQHRKTCGLAERFSMQWTILYQRLLLDHPRHD